IQAIEIFVRHTPIKWIRHRLPYPCATKSDFDRAAYGLGNPRNPDCAKGDESNRRAGGVKRPEPRRHEGTKRFSMIQRTMRLMPSLISFVWKLTRRPRR